MTDQHWRAGSSHPIILHVAAQNAGILVYRHDNSVVLEMFELSAQNHEVMGTKGRLLRKFPGVAIQIPTAKVEPALIRTVACTLGRMSGQVVAETVPTTSKDGRVHEEIRDTAHPKVVTELLMAFLLPFGEAAKVTSISKHTRDDVLWKNCEKPWRRSPLWLLLKVCIQLVFLRSGLEEQDALDLYKHFMVCFAGHILSQTASRLKKDPVCLEWCDIVYAMRAKISRRILKLRKPLPKPIQNVMADNILQRTWDDIRRSEAQTLRVDIESLESLDFEKDTHANLPKLDEFIDSISKRKGETMQGDFTPSCRVPEFDNIADLSRRGSIGTSEQWGVIGAWCDRRVSYLNAWLDPKLQREPLDATSWCTALWNDMKAYEEMVHKCCGQNPEAISLMVLGVMELWVACDRLACKECPLLLEYDPDIDVCRLQSLLLPFLPQMKRLHAVEDYVERRQKAGIHKHIWTSFGQADTFAARYFDQSAGHKALRRRIEESAWETRERKIKSFNETKQLYSALMNEVRTTECSQVTEMRNGQEYRFHRHNSCERCIKEDRATGMDIKIHEWPLPSAETDLKTVVFELNVPQWFSVWREATNLVRFKLLQCSYTLEDSPPHHQQFPLQDDLHLKSQFDSRLSAGTSPSCGLLSSVKPNARTHYNRKYISVLARVDEVLFDNASRFQYFDFVRGCMAAALSPTEGMESLTQSMTYRLPSRSQAVQQFIHRPPTSANGPGPNVVLSSQSGCPSHLSLTEYKALCTIPQGIRIQWQNILLEVTAPHIDFKKEESTKVVLQCMYQAGPDDGSKRWCRDAHLIPAKNKAFGPKMIKALRHATTRIEKNWRCIDELACYVAIARRILSLSPSDALMQDVLTYLSKARKVGLSWVNVLKERVDSVTDDDDKCRFRSRVAHAALVCVDTFNFQDTFSKGKDILELQSAADITDFISCCITIQECYTPTSDGLDSILYWRWQQLCFHTYPILHRAIVDNSSEGLNVAIRRSWVAFNPTGSGWTSWPISGCRHGGMAWLTTESVSTSGGRSLAVHYCLVTGELRVNGLPLNRLPREYDTHPMYKTLFGRSVLEVMPGDVPGMIFSGKKRYAGHEVHFGLSPGVGNQRVLLVRAIKNDQSWEFVNPKFLQGFPHRFVSGYVHWYDLSSNTIEFRPLEEPWVASEENWKLGVTKKKEWQLTKGNYRILVIPKLLNTQSETAERMDKIFGRLVEAANLELVYRPSSSLLEIELPTLKLAFHLEKGSSTLQSRQFRGMGVDPDQDIGTLISFENKLVLKSNSQDKRRKVILLEGPMTHNLRNSHTRVHVAKGVAVLSHAYDVDIRLGRLKDNGSLESKLLLCYLHALTSFCLPDPMTKRTGTEQALGVLNSAAVKSFNVFSSKHIDMLGKIAALTQKRLHYPRNLEVMQQVSWSTTLGFLAQHNGFYQAVTSLFDGVMDRAFFYKDRYIKPPEFEKTTRELVRRDEIRTAAFRVSGYGAEEHTTKEDREYPSRDMGQDSARCHTAFSMADYIVNHRERLPKEIPASPRRYIWNYLIDVAGESVLGAMHPLNLRGSEDNPEYDAHWLFDTHNEILG
ncbi:hypothetical protein IMZ48_28635, partial [Candidatus Bathyarchaeota archaeon]|nr:hypothetical protein [Candidatus Bathyarchaeota archaeon]